MKNVKVGKRYVKRDGSITGKMENRGGDYLIYIYRDPQSGYTYTDKGTFFREGGDEHGKDLIKLHNPKPKYKVSEKFIKEAHTQACQVWKEKIETEFPKLFPKKEEMQFEKDKWYRYIHNPNFTFCFDGDLKTKKRYGFNTDGDWCEALLDYTDITRFRDKYRVATDSEVQTALKKEAVKRGFKKGVKIRCISGNQFFLNSRSGVYFDSDNSFCIGGYEVFKAGQWAETVKEQPIIHITIQEIADLKGVSVDKIRVKD